MYPKKEVALLTLACGGDLWYLLLLAADHCPNGWYYTVQPPTELKCNPVGTFLFLRCATVRGNVTWYWSQCVHDADVNGTAILPGDNSDAYVVSNFSETTAVISFLVTNSTLGYYWCEISNSSLRPSIVTPVFYPTNASLHKCTYSSVEIAHNFMSGNECAVIDSHTIYTRVPLPSFCPLVRTCISYNFDSHLDMHVQASPITSVLPTRSTPNITPMKVALIVLCGACAILIVLILVLLLIAWHEIVSNFNRRICTFV